MDKQTRSAIETATRNARRLLDEDFTAQLEGDFDVRRDGSVEAVPSAHLSPRQVSVREKIVSALEHKQAAGMTVAESVSDYIRDAAFTTLNRFVALKMLEARSLVQECITKGEQSAGYREFYGLAPSLPLLPGSAGYRLYLESLFDELSTEVKVLFDRRDPASALWPRRATFEALLTILNDATLADVWGEDETIGWVYQYFNSADERSQMRSESQAPRNSRELAIRNQFFTPRYVVQFLTDNTLGRIWYEMRGTQTALADRCEYLVRLPGEVFDPRRKKDPRDLRILDPACGSGHFLLYAFDLLITVYEEAYADPESPACEATGTTLADNYLDLDALRAAIPGLVLAYNLHGVDIDPRCVQIAQLTLWMRAQRAYSDFGIARAKRPQIRRSNVVLAEPLVADESVAKDFLARLDDYELRHAFTELVDALALAGDLGLLLRVEQRRAQPLAPGYDSDLLTPAENRLQEVLGRYAAELNTQVSMRRRLFAEDTTQGLGLLAIADQKYDVVLMNPPFGAVTDRSTLVLGKEDCGNLYSAFVRRAIELATGAVGCITDRTFLTQATFASFRHELLTGHMALHALCDLGSGVLDANVQTAAYVLLTSSREVACIDARPVEDRAGWLSNHHEWKWVALKSFAGLPDSILAYGVPASVLSRIGRWKSLAEIATLPRGLGSNSAFRTYLSWVEVPQQVGARQRWEPLANGGEFSPWWREDRGVADWRMPNGEEWISMTARDPWRPYDQSGSSAYFRAGLSFPKQSSSFNVALLPDGFIPTREGKAILPQAAKDSWHLLAYLNSGVVRAFVRDTCGLHKQSGSIGRIPVPDFSDLEKAHLARIAESIIGSVRSSYERDETSRLFIGPAQLVKARRKRLHDIEVRKLLSELDDLVLRRFEIAPEDMSWAESAAEPVHYGVDDANFSLMSWAVGVAFGRFNDRITNIAEFEQDPSRPYRSPAMDAMAYGQGSMNLIYVDDVGHRRDLTTSIMSVLSPIASGDSSEGVAETLSEDGVRQLLRRRFFQEHIAKYTTARRKAPIYWQLGTPSASYSVWLYIHVFSGDTMFRVQNDYVVPKLRHEESRLETMEREAGDKATAAQRRAIAEQETFVGELRGFLDEVKRVAPLWNPDLNDGVIINFAPLWRLVPHLRPWQKELKATWDTLCEGKYDWAHLAMRLWPERVVPKCAADRSLAIAHGLEDVFWAQGADGRWATRTTPTRPIDEVIAERASDAVKAALRSLLDAPTIVGARAGRRRSPAGTSNRGGR